MAFITLSGIEGSGKTTQINFLKSFFESRGKDVLVTREPGGTRIGQKIRALLLDPENTDICSRAELFLYAADRAQHLEAVVKPALKKGVVVISDRFADCTTAFQGYGRGIDLDLIQQIHTLVLSGMSPDISFLLDLPVEVGLKRALGDVSDGTRDVSESRFEQEKLSFHEKVRAGYLALSKAEPERIKVISATDSVEEVSRQIGEYIEAVILAE